MWRTQAVKRMLVEEVAGLGRQQAGEDAAGAALRRARSAAWRAVALDWAAIAVLLAVRLGDSPLLPVGPTADSIVTIGLLVVAVHSGFRLGQAEKLRAVSALVDDLTQRS